MKKSKCEGKMSKAQKASRSTFKKLWPEIESEAAYSDFHEDFCLGAEALLRYAKRNGFPAHRLMNNGSAVQFVSLDLLEEWVKGKGK